MVNTRSTSRRRRNSSATVSARASSAQTTPEICRCCNCNIVSNPRIKPTCTYLIAISIIMVIAAIIINNCFELRSDETENDTSLSTDIAEKRAYIESTKEKDSLDPKERLIKNPIRKYDADQSGKCDYALESLGGKILHVGSTKTFYEPETSLFGLTFLYLRNTFYSPYQAAAVILQPRVLPGDCWAFYGSKGTVTIQLYGYILITGVTLEHIPVSMSPTSEITSAPKEFSITGLVNEDHNVGINFGIFLYDIHDQENPVQYFEIPNKYDVSFRVVRIDIFSNWGNELFTCVYRLRIHGNLDVLSVV